MIEQGLYTYLTAQAALTTHVSTRIHPNVAPQGADKPFIVYGKSTGAPTYDMTGETGLASARFQFAIVADQYSSVKTIADALRKELSGYRGAMGSEDVRRVSLESESDEWLAPASADERGFHQITQDYEFWFTQTTPSF